MSSQALARIVVKLFGLYLYVTSAIAVFELLAMMPIYSGEGPHELAWVFIICSFASIVVSAAAATLLIKATDWVVKIGFTAQETDIAGIVPSEKAIMAVAISVVGLLFAVIGVCGIMVFLVQWVGIIPTVSNGNPGDFLSFRGKELILALAQVLVGLFLFVGHDTVYRLWKKGVSLFPGETEQKE